MKTNSLPAPATLQTVLDRLAGDSGLSQTRKRDLRSAVTSFAKLRDQPPASIPLDLADIRQTLDGMVPAWAKVSPKRWANLRSDLAAPIGTSGLRPMLQTANLSLDEVWMRLLAPAAGESGLASRGSPDGRAHARFGQRPSMTARSNASSPNWLQQAWLGPFGTCPAPSPGRGTRL